VPFLLRAPMQRAAGETLDTLLNVWDLMPTLLGLLGLPISDTVEGLDLSPVVRGEPCAEPDAALACIICPFGEYQGEEWRAVRTRRHTYAQTISGPWLLYDNLEDPYQLENRVNQPDSAALQGDLEALLARELRRFGDEFLPAVEYRRRWGYQVDARGNIPYTTELPAA